MEHRGAKIQILDLPGLIKGAAEGKGRGKEILGVIRAADMVLFIVDPFQDGHFDVLYRELHNAGLRLNEERPRFSSCARTRAASTSAPRWNKPT